MFNIYSASKGLKGLKSIHNTWHTCCVSWSNVLYKYTKRKKYIFHRYRNEIISVKKKKKAKQTVDLHQSHLFFFVLLSLWVFLDFLSRPLHPTIPPSEGLFPPVRFPQATVRHGSSMLHFSIRGSEHFAG